jgi:hypothetical protein
MEGDKEVIKKETFDKITFVTKGTGRFVPAQAEAGKPLRMQVLKGELQTLEGSGTLYFDTIKSRPAEGETRLKLEGSFVISLPGAQAPKDRPDLKDRAETRIRQEVTTTVRVMDESPLPPR